METTKIYETAKEEIVQFYNVGTDKDVLARYIAEDISLAVVAIYGKGSDAKYLLDAIANKVQSWCNPVLNDDEEKEEEEDTADSPLTEALQYVRENMDEDDKAILNAEVNKCYKMHFVPNSQLVDCSQVIDLMEEYADEHDLPESWWEEYADIDEILNKLLEE
ncbi:MAG: hypothetical protein IKQ32_06000 [Prevotella sp.]|nr:hypothetical protein [Prevotella sp.]